MRGALVVVLAGCASAASTPRGTSGGETPPAVCIDDAERAEIATGGTTDERFAEAMGLVDVATSGGERSAIEIEGAEIRAIVLFDSIESDAAADPSRARVAAMLAIEALSELGSSRPGCAGEPCARLDATLARHCPVELPDDDLTAVCPTLRRYRARCGGTT